MSSPDPSPTAAPSPSPAHSGKRPGPRAAMITGFCALLALMVVLSYDSIHALRTLEADSARVRQDYLNRERTLREVRSSLYESGNLLREYTLLESDSRARQTYLSQLHDMRDLANAALDSSLRGLPSDQQAPFQKLASELNSYWLVADRIFSPGPLAKNDLPLRQVVQAQRAAVLSITGEVSDINEMEFRQAEREISNVFAQSRRRLQAGAALAFLLGIFLAASTILHVSRLERHAEEKYLESLRSQRELKELSKRLVDAQEHERRAISRELHDQIGQSLSALLMDVQNLADTPPASGSSRNGLQKIKLLAEECVNDVRNMALLLRPSMLDDLGLIAALEWQGREVSRRTGLVVDVIDDHFADNLPEEHKTCIYRIVQEALHNCAQHARATHVRILVQENSNRLVLSIEDDGVGFDPLRQRGMGFLGMNERVTRLGGTFAVDSSPGHGTRLRIELPLTPSRRSDGAPS